MAFLQKVSVVYVRGYIRLQDEDNMPPTELVQTGLVVCGFLCQVAGICDVAYLETMRLLLFKFGGYATSWTEERCDACVEYFHLLGMKVVDGKIGMHGRSVFFRLRALAVMGTFGSDKLQKLLLSENEEDKIDELREERYELFRGIWLDHDSFGRRYPQFIEKWEAFHDESGVARALQFFRESETWKDSLQLLRSKRNRLVGMRLKPRVGSGNLDMAEDVEALIEEFEDYGAERVSFSWGARGGDQVNLKKTGKMRLQHTKTLGLPADDAPLPGQPDQREPPDGSTDQREPPDGKPAEMGRGV
jgi:hypothetical protein